MDNRDEFIKVILHEKEKIKQRYKSDLELIKQHYGVSFEINYFNDEKINNIKFTNISYNNDLYDFSITYDNVNNYFNFIDYNYSNIRNVKRLNHKKIIPTINKKYKLQLVVSEINRANVEYLNEINDINERLEDYKNTDNLKEKQLEISKKEDN